MGAARPARADGERTLVNGRGAGAGLLRANRTPRGVRRSQRTRRGRGPSPPREEAVSIPSGLHRRHRVFAALRAQNDLARLPRRAPRQKAQSEFEISSGRPPPPRSAPVEPRVPRVTGARVAGPSSVGGGCCADPAAIWGFGGFSLGGALGPVVGAMVTRWQRVDARAGHLRANSAGPSADAATLGLGGDDRGTVARATGIFARSAHRGAVGIPLVLGGRHGSLSPRREHGGRRPMERRALHPWRACRATPRRVERRRRQRPRPRPRRLRRRPPLEAAR